MKFGRGGCFNNELCAFMTDHRSVQGSNKKNDKPKGAGKGVVIFFICILIIPHIKTNWDLKFGRGGCFNKELEGSLLLIIDQPKI